LHTIFITKKIQFMKKIYLSAIALGVLSSSVAQQIQRPVFSEAKVVNPTSNVIVSSSPIQSGQRSVLWEDDFSTPANWTMTNTSSPALDWTITTNVNVLPVASMRPVGFTTAANGFAKIDSDGAGASATQNATMTYNTPIDLTGYQNVAIKFQQAARKFQDTYTLKVSGDGGSTWTNYIINPTLQNNTETTNPAYVQVNISPVAGNQADVRVAFHYTAAFGWFWAVDDIEIIELFDYDLALNSVYWGSTGAGGVKVPYYQIPIAQIAPIEFTGSVENKGALTQGPVTFAVNSGAYNGTAVEASINPGSIVEMNTTSAFTPASSVASHTITFGVSSSETDAVPADNTLPNETIAVTQNLYARASDVQTSATTGGIYQGSDPIQFQLGVFYDMFANGTIYAVKAFVDQNTEVGAELYATLYNGADLSFLATSSVIKITTAQLGTYVNIPLLTPYAATAGTSVFAAVGASNSDAADKALFIGTSGVSVEGESLYTNPSATNWTIYSETPMIKLDFSQAAGVVTENQAFVLGQNMPNPFANTSVINYTLTSTEDITFEIVDMTGKVVKVIREGVRTAGSYAITINSNELSEGVYFYSMTNGTSKVTKSMVVTK
jgi:hypothetical protein